MKHARVLFEASPMVDSGKTGVGYYVQSLIRGLGEYKADELELTGYYFDLLALQHKELASIPGIGFKKITFPPAKLLSLARRLGFQLPLELFTARGSDIVFYTNYVSLPLLKRRKVALAVYDLSFLDHPEYMQDVNLRYLQRFCSKSITSADMIITISEFTKERLLHHFPQLQADIVVTPIPPTEAPEPGQLSERLTNLGIEDDKYLLHVGTLEPRKNLGNLLAAYLALPAETRKQYALVLAGGSGWKNETLLDSIREAQDSGEHVILTGYVSDEEKAALYAHATLFVMPSHYEGFGMPIFEAFQYGTPVAVSDIPVFREIAANAAQYFDKDSPEAIRSELEKLLNQPALREQLTREGTKRLNVYSWGSNAEVVMAAFKRLVS